jgi:uridine kinase
MTEPKFVEKRDGAIVPFVQQRITNAIFRAAVSVGGRDKTLAKNLSDQVVDILKERDKEMGPPAVEEIQDIVEKVLIENGHAKVAKAYILYREERKQRREAQKDEYQPRSDYLPWQKMWKVLDWAVEHELNTVEKLNERIRRGEAEAIVRESEEAYQQDIKSAVDFVLAQRNDIKIVIIAGPSSSGKTTTTRKIARKLTAEGLSFVELNLDNYYFDVELHPKDEFGDYDYETPQALDMNLINLHLNELLSGKEVKIPFYDFETSKRHLDRTPMKVGKDDVILIDSLYGLYPPMMEGIDERKARFYIEPILQIKDINGEYIKWTDIRLIRRMLRDATHRALNFQETLTHWHYVRSGEKRSILPYLGSADLILNSGMPYELGLYSHKLLDNFRTWANQYQNDPLRKDAYKRASRVLNLLETITPLPEDNIVPKDSVIREFIGGLYLD